MNTKKSVVGIALLLIVGASAKTKKPDPQRVPLDQYIEQAMHGVQASTEASPGSLFIRTGLLADGLRDLRASRVFDLVTIVVADRASAVSTGVTKSSRKSSAKSSVTALAGALKATNPLANLTGMSGDTELQGQGTTSRDSTLTTTVTAQVTNVLPNGTLVIQGQKEINVNSEHQTVTIRGMIRPEDLSPANQIASDRVAMMEIRVTGKGVVNDAIRRPFILYRILLGLLPF